MALRADVTDLDGRPVVVLIGSVDLSTVPPLHNALTRAVVEHPGERVAVDLDGVDTLDDTGLGVLLGAAGRARRTGGDLLIVCTNPVLLDRFRLTGLDRAVTIAPRLTAPTTDPA